MKEEESDKRDCPTAGWIELLYKRHRAGHALHSAYLLNLTNSFIAEEADSVEDGRSLLREAALSHLASENAEVVAQSLLYLGVVGSHRDLEVVNQFTEHESDLVQRAARACSFELRKER